MSAGVFADVAAIKNKGEIVIGTLGTDEPNSFVDAQVLGNFITQINLVTNDLTGLGVTFLSFSSEILR